MTDQPRNIACICSKGDIDMAYPALIMGWAALGNGHDVTIFFTFWGMDMIRKSRVDNLQMIFILYQDATKPRWQQVVDKYAADMPDSDPALVPPNGLLQPMRSLGLAWRSTRRARRNSTRRPPAGCVMPCTCAAWPKPPGCRSSTSRSGTS